MVLVYFQCCNYTWNQNVSRYLHWWNTKILHVHKRYLLCFFKHKIFEHMTFNDFYRVYRIVNWYFLSFKYLDTCMTTSIASHCIAYFWNWQFLTYFAEYIKPISVLKGLPHMISIYYLINAAVPLYVKYNEQNSNQHIDNIAQCKSNSNYGNLEAMQIRLHIVW